MPVIIQEKYSAEEKLHIYYTLDYNNEYWDYCGNIQNNVWVNSETHIWTNVSGVWYKEVEK